MRKEDKSIQQAVILAGGQGTRLRPITDSLPKPMIEFGGKPFLEYLIKMLRNQGIRKILLLLGYLPDKISDYFGDGRELGMEIKYSVSPVEYDTGKRLLTARGMLENHFFLMYCDNYWPLNLKEIWEHYLSNDCPAQITVYANEDNYTRDNVKMGDNGKIVLYDKSRTEAGLQGVDIGYAVLKKEIVDLLSGQNVNFEKEIYPTLAREGKLAGYLTRHRYYSVGSHDRLPLTTKFLKREPAVILDRDGVLNEKPPRAQYVTRWEEFKWLPGAKEAVSKLKQKKYRIILVTNQAGISRGMMSSADMQTIHKNMSEELSGIDAIYHCPHGWDEGCDCRKPAPGMFFAAQKDFNLDLSRTYYVGDDERDAAAACNAGCNFLLCNEDNPLLKIVEENF